MCYRLMAVIAVIDIGAILVGGTMTGVLSIIGLPYCLHQTFFKLYNFCAACRFYGRINKANSFNYLYF